MTSPLVLVIVAMIDNPCIQLLLPICVWPWGQPLGLGQPTGSYLTRERPSLINHTVNNSSAKGMVLGAPFPVPNPQKEHFIMRKALDTFANVLISILVKKIKRQSCCTQCGMSKRCALTVSTCCSLIVTTGLLQNNSEQT